LHNPGPDPPAKRRRQILSEEGNGPRIWIFDVPLVVPKNGSKGNPVKCGNGPAAVAPPFSYVIRRGNPFSMH